MLQENINQLKGDTLKEAIEKYASGEYDIKRLNPRSSEDRSLFLIDLKKWFDTTSWTFSDITARAYLNHRKKTKNQYGKLPEITTINSYIKKIRAFNSFLVRQDYLTKNFCQLITKLKEPEKPPVIYELKTIEKAIILGTRPGKGDNLRNVQIKKEGRVALLFMLRSPRRSGEIWKLKGSDINENGTYDCVVKGGKRMNFPIPESQYEELMTRRHKKKVFEVWPETLAKYLRDGLRALGEAEEVIKGVRVHNIRKWVAVDKLNRGWSLKKVSQLLGHEKQTTTEKYYLPYVSTHLKEITDDNPLDPDILPLTKQVDNARVALEKVFSGNRFEQPRVTVEDGYISYRIPLTQAGIEEMKKPNKRNYWRGVEDL